MLANDLDYPIAKLKGIAALFSINTNELELGGDEVYGINWLLGDIAKEIEKIKDKIIENHLGTDKQDV